MPEEEAQELADKRNAYFLETSAKTGSKVSELFKFATKRFYQRYLNR